MIGYILLVFAGAERGRLFLRPAARLGCRARAASESSIRAQVITAPMSPPGRHSVDPARPHLVVPARHRHRSAPACEPASGHARRPRQGADQPAAEPRSRSVAAGNVFTEPTPTIQAAAERYALGRRSPVTRMIVAALSVALARPLYRPVSRISPQFRARHATERVMSGFMLAARSSPSSPRSASSCRCCSRPALLRPRVAVRVLLRPATGSRRSPFARIRSPPAAPSAPFRCSPARC